MSFCEIAFFSHFIYLLNGKKDKTQKQPNISYTYVLFRENSGQSKKKHKIKKMNVT